MAIVVSMGGSCSLDVYKERCKLDEIMKIASKIASNLLALQTSKRQKNDASEINEIDQLNGREWLVKKLIAGILTRC